MASRVLTCEQAGAGRAAHGLVGEHVPVQRALPRHGIQIGRQIHRIFSVCPNRIRPYLVRNDDDDIRL